MRVNQVAREVLVVLGFLDGHHNQHPEVLVDPVDQEALWLNLHEDPAMNGTGKDITRFRPYTDGPDLSNKYAC